MKTRYFKGSRSLAIWRFSDEGAHVRGILKRTEWITSVCGIEDMVDMGAIEIPAEEGEPEL